MNMSMAIDIRYNPEQRQTEICCDSRQMDTSRIAGTVLPEWVMPFQLGGTRWLGISTELRQFAGDEPFTVRYHGPEDVYPLLVNALTESGIPLAEPELIKAPEPETETPASEQMQETTIPTEPEMPQVTSAAQPVDAMSKKTRITAKQIFLLGGTLVSAVLLTVFLLDIRKQNGKYKELRQQSAELKAASVRQNAEKQPAQTDDITAEDSTASVETAQTAASTEAVTETTTQTEPASSAFSPNQLLNMTAGEIQEQYSCSTDVFNWEGLALMFVSDDFPDVWPIFVYSDDMTVPAEEKPFCIIVFSGNATDTIAVGMKTNELTESAGIPDSAFYSLMDDSILLTYLIADAEYTVVMNNCDDAYIFFGEKYELEPKDVLAYLKAHRSEVVRVEIKPAQAASNGPETAAEAPAAPAKNYTALYGDKIAELDFACADEWVRAYTLVDLDGDGFKELIVRYGSGEANMVFEFFSGDNYLGELPAGHSGMEMDGDKLYINMWHRGYQSVDWVYLSGDKLVTENVFCSGDEMLEDYRSFGKAVKFCDLADTSLLEQMSE